MSRARAATASAGDNAWDRLRGFRTLGPSGAISKVNLLHAGHEPMLVEAPVDGRWWVHHGEQDWTLRVAVHGDSVEIDQDGKQISARGVVAGDEVQLWLAGHRRVFDLGLQAESGAAKQGAAADDGQIRSPMPGVVSEIGFKPGEAVMAGQTVAVIEFDEAVLASPDRGDDRWRSDVDRKQAGDVVTAHQRLLTIAAAEANEGAQRRKEAHSQ